MFLLLVFSEGGVRYAKSGVLTRKTIASLLQLFRGV